MPASANLPGSSFEGNDGNQIVDGNPLTAHDWINAPNLEVGTDLVSGQGDNSFGNGTQEKDLNVTVGLGSIPNSKANLGQFATASETLANGDVMMYLAWTRLNQTGSTNFDFEINKAPQPDLTTSGPKTLVRTPGDLLINYSLQGGAQVETLNYRTWQANGTWSGVTPLAAPIAEAKINSDGAIANTFGGPQTTIPQSQFGEASINMTEAGLIANQNDPNAACEGFGSAYVKSRASQSFTSEIKDFIAPIPLHLNNCGTIVIEKVTVPAGDPTEFDFTLTGGPSALNESFSLTDGESFSTGSDVKAGTGYDSGETVPDGWALTSAVCDDGSDPDNIDLSAGETVTCTYTNTLQIGAVLIHKTAKHADSETGTIDQEGVTFTITNDGEDTDVDVVTDADGYACADGLLVSSVVGDYTVTETVPAGYVSEDSVQDYTVVVGDCESILPSAALEFVNVPLTNVTVSVDSQVDGGTASVIECGGDPVNTETNGDGSLTVSDLEPTDPAVTLTCTVTIDP